jgi:hypothetical protein
VKHIYPDGHQDCDVTRAVQTRTRQVIFANAKYRASARSFSTKEVSGGRNESHDLSIPDVGPFDFRVTGRRAVEGNIGAQILLNISGWISAQVANGRMPTELELG